MREYRLQRVSKQVFNGDKVACGLDDYPVQCVAELRTADLAIKSVASTNALGKFAELCAENDSERNERADEPTVAVQYVTFPNISVRHACSTRVGGVSSGAYCGLNIGQTTQDAPSAVHENRLRLQAATGLPVRQMLNMVHGRRVVKFAASPKSLRVGDACITDVPGVPLTITTADCVPIIFHDPQHKAIGLAHAGWRGTADKIAQYTLQAMHEHYGTSPQYVQVAVGPSIGPCCFQVGQDVVEHFKKAFPGQELTKIDQNSNKYINLWLANLLTLLEVGVPARNVCFCGLCSCCRRDLFYSYRCDLRVTGRLATLVML